MAVPKKRERESGGERRLAKKALKRARVVAEEVHKRGVLSSIAENSASRFGDPDLKKPFVWEKKIKRDVATGKLKDLRKQLSVSKELERHKQLLTDAESIEAARQVRAIQRSQREADRDFLERERLQLESKEWERKEQEFELQQMRGRAIRRLKDGYPRPLDLVWQGLDDGRGLPRRPPWEMLESLGSRELEAAREEIDGYYRLDSEGGSEERRQFWDALLQYCDALLTTGVDSRHASVRQDVDKMLLQRANDDGLEEKVKAMLKSGSAVVVEFWEEVLKRLPMFKARARMQQIWAGLKAEAAEDALEEDMEEEPAQVEEEHKVQVDEKAAEEKSAAGASKLLRSGADETIEAEAATLADEQVGLIKPKYRTRVYSGYEWNKYNQTHYDQDNPPPKIVQGYDFQISYPNLPPGSKPEVAVVDANWKEETCLLVFRAGPPYQDLAFRIVYRDWEMSAKNGYKCSWDGKVMELSFKFKRYKYRR